KRSSSCCISWIQPLTLSESKSGRGGKDSARSRDFSVRFIQLMKTNTSPSVILTADEAHFTSSSNTSSSMATPCEAHWRCLSLDQFVGSYVGRITESCAMPYRHT